MVVQAEVTLTELQQIQREPEQVVDELSQLKPADRDAIHWYKLSRAYLALQQKDAALQSVDMALALGLDPADTVQALEHKAMVYGMLFRNSQLAIAALIQAEQQITHLQSAQKPQLQTSLYESFAQAYNQQGNITEAIRYADLSIAIATEHQLPAAELPARLTAGRLALQQNHFALTQLHLDRALTLALALNKTESLVSIHTRLAMAYRKLNQFNQALDHATSALQLLPATGDQSIAIRLWLLQADSYQQLGDNQRSDEILQQAHQAAQRLQDPHYLALVYHGQAQLAVSNGALPQAKALLTQALQLLSQIGHQSQLQEIQLAYVDVALAQQDWHAAALQFPEISTLADAPEFLQQRYWELLARLRAGQLRWQEAYVATQQAATLQNQQWQSQQKSTVDLLNQRLVQQQLTTDFEQSQQHNRLLSILSLVLAAFLSLMAVLFFPRRNSWWQAHGTSTTARDPRGASQLAPVSSWAEFSQQLSREQQKTGSLYLQCIQLAEPQQLKLACGEQFLREHWLQLVNSLPDDSLAAITVDTDAVWLVWRATDEALPALMQQVHATLLQQQAEFPSPPAIFSFVAPLQPLLGAHWRIADLAGIRELVWLSWQLATDQQRGQRQYLVHLSCPQPLPCSWQTANVRLDISNALRLGLITLHCNGLPLASP